MAENTLLENEISQGENREDMPSPSGSSDDLVDSRSYHSSSAINDEPSNSEENLSVSGTSLKRKQARINHKTAKSSAKISRNHENRKSQKTHSKTDCPFCGVTLTFNEFSDHVNIHALDLFTFKKTRKRTQQVEPHPSHKKDFGTVLKQRCERPQAQSLSAKSEIVCPFCKERFVWRNNDGRQEARNHLESCREHNLKTALEILQEVPSGSSATDDFSDLNDLTSLSDDYLGSDMLRITSSDENEILDIENDDTVLYGPNQYSDQDALPLSTENTENSVILSSGDIHDEYDSSAISNENAAVFSDNDESEGDEEENIKDDFSSVEGLKRKLKELHETRGAMCPVCKDVYKTPLTAIGCWHVLCESCWLTALTVKKICPVCKTIVSSDALRRVYI